ncbi:hypothetical protein NDA11_004045 [Ustilago hordei]|uniref:Related to REX2-Oligoribonuclease, mitochondrial n=1 Tax=Ustilago hordei TaxID=120017 RepID=I2FVQ1_USTHO|nr:uncharacterized protein UHO2_04531 [Ustilago hordei]KAJ1042497.1 hypothetical protein NDA10_004150 [Ustilago hordei]KAJ1578105.1 hypothetical protein NDA12_004766 [Ustilago hordei]KAJ1578350.1 hypothetical protein NDA11_004045 [Ustilago hordei]KAJ1592590.1 hypothetical protein NDA15_006845 [Ustilago hordei]KAJ1595804.1 hypothetical protein NDA14_003816 [Ustilago hordei]
MSTPTSPSLPDPASLSPIPPPRAASQLDASWLPLVWIDCEMTGLNVEAGDRLLEIACIITDGELNPIDDGVSYVISTPSSILDSMNDWCRTQHASSGLTLACSSPAPYSHPHADVRTAMLAYVRDRVPLANSACLAGNTVHADKVFLVKEMPELVRHLHYRIVDVSSIKELVKRWYGPQAMWPGQAEEKATDQANHRALSDIKASIAELKWYRERYFKPSHTLS